MIQKLRVLIFVTPELQLVTFEVDAVFFMQSTKGSSTAHFGGLKNLATTAALELHLGAGKNP